MTGDHHEYVARDGTTRKDYYGAGQQPWDLIVRWGYGAAFAAGNVLKYLRKTKGEPGRDAEKARWYWERLQEMLTARDRPGAPDVRSQAYAAIKRLQDVLTPGEKARLAGREAT